MENVNEINTIIFLETLLYYIQPSKSESTEAEEAKGEDNSATTTNMSDLIQKRKNLESMLTCLFESLS